MIQPVQNYRLGDVVNGWIEKQHRRDPGYPSASRYCSHWQGTLGCDYVRECTGWRNYSCFVGLVRAKGCAPREGDAETVVVHLRLGDVLDLPYYQLQKRNAYVLPLSKYENGFIPRWIKRVSIVSNVSFRAYTGHSRSQTYLARVLATFRQRGFETVRAEHATADEDFLHMACSRYFMPSGGGFSSLAALVVRHYNHTLL